MQDNAVEKVKDDFLRELRSAFGDRVKKIRIKEITNIPHPMLSIDFEAYQYFSIRLNYDRGSFGFCIINGEHHAVKLEPSGKWFEETDLLSFYSDLKEDIELRIPDKFLRSRGWL